jgi:outer membrane immunogenic protein
MKRYLIPIALVAGAVLATSANAADVYNGGLKDGPAADISSGPGVNWSGVYIGAHGGYGNANHEVSADVDFSDGEEGSSTHNLFNLDGINSRGFVGGIDAGADVASGGWVFGVLGGYSFSNMESSLSVFDGEGKWTLAKQGEWYLGGRVGRVVAPRTMVYLLAAYTQTEYELSGTFLDEKPSQSYSGIKAGTGIEYALSNNVFLGLQYDHDFYGKQDWINEDGFKVTDNLDEDKIQATFKIKFGGGLPYLGD